MTSGRTAVAVAALVVTLITATGCGEREAADDQGFHQDVVNGSNGAEVTFDATLVNDPIQSGDHEHLVVKAATGERLTTRSSPLTCPPTPATGSSSTGSSTSIPVPWSESTAPTRTPPPGAPTRAGSSSRVTITSRNSQIRLARCP